MSAEKRGMSLKPFMRTLSFVAIAGGLSAAAILCIPQIIARTEIPSHLSSANSVSRIANRHAYDAMSGDTNAGRMFHRDQLLFVVDRRNGDRVYWLNTRKYAFHVDFLHRTYLSTQDDKTLIRSSYQSDDRRFVLGSVVHYPRLDRYGVEMWEGDTISLPLLRQTMGELQATFFAPLGFKPNSTRQEEMVAGTPGFPVIAPNDAYEARSSAVLNPGVAVGRLRIVDDPETATLGRDEIVILRSNPVTLTPVAGIVTTHFSTPLTHVNLLAGTWKVPNAYLAGADATYAALAGKDVVFTAKDGRIAIRLALPDEIAQSRQQRRAAAPRLPHADLAYLALPSLLEQHASDVVRTGAKAANLGEVARLAGSSRGAFSVPPGFSIPFAWYDRFVRENGLQAHIDALLANQALRRDPRRLKAALAHLRDAFDRGRMPAELMDQVQARRATVTGPGGVFARSSTNSEDLKGFNGAGLYTSVPNVTDEEQLAAAIRTVWGSVWNDRAFAAREAAGIDHRGVRASVLIQKGVDADASGVMVTANPYEREDPEAVFINAKKGLGMRVVEGRKVAEQLIYRTWPNETVQVLTRSDDDTMLSFDKRGGTRSIAIEKGRAILTDDLTRRLARTGNLIEKWFDGRPQDIEWLTDGGAIVIVQARPYMGADR